MLFITDLLWLVLLFTSIPLVDWIHKTRKKLSLGPKAVIPNVPPPGLENPTPNRKPRFVAKAIAALRWVAVNQPIGSTVRDVRAIPD